MNKKIEKSNKDKILRRLAKNLRAIGFIRTKPTFFVRVNGLLVEFLHIHKFTFQPAFRVHVCLRVLSDPRDFVALLGIDSDTYGRPNSPKGKKYNFSYHQTDETISRCVQSLQNFVEEVAEPWFESWRDLDVLLNSPDSPLPNEDKDALKLAMQGKHSQRDVARTNELLRIA